MKCAKKKHLPKRIHGKFPIFVRAKKKSVRIQETFHLLEVAIGVYLEAVNHPRTTREPWIMLNPKGYVVR